MTINRKGLSLRSESGLPYDIYLDDSGNLAIVEDAVAIGEHVRQRIMTFSGEWFLDKDAGVAWLSELLGKSYDGVLAESILKAEILNTDGVSEITSFSVRFDRETRGLISSGITIGTVYGEEAEASS